MPGKRSYKLNAFLKVKTVKNNPKKTLINPGILRQLAFIFGFGFFGREVTEIFRDKVISRYT